jgi:RNA polymerase sigma-70 factor (ECF subfamily)
VSDPDTDLMLRVKSGEAGAFERLVARFLRPLVSFFHRLGADVSTAEDCAQEVFVKLFRTRGSYEPKARFTTFLFAVARHHWIDVVRHRAAGPTTVSSDVAGDATSEEAGTLSERLPAGDAPPSHRAEDSEMLAAMRRAIDALAPDHREVFALAQVEGLRYEEVARILGVPVGTVKSRMHAAVGILRDRLRREGFEP